MNGAATATTSADCELLGRGSVQGSADSDSLAALVRQLTKQQQRDRLLGRRCTVICGREVGLEIAPYQRKRPDDEGFESDEDLASLGSYEDPSKRKTGTLAAASAAAGAVSDSANSSGVSEDSDDADAASLGEQTAASAIDAAACGDGGAREVYGLADVAFCHTDAAALPGIAVWVIKTRRCSVAGLEAIVVRSRDDRLQDVCRAYQELSRRFKLEPKPWTGGQAAAGSGGGGTFSQRRKFVGGGGGGNVTLTATPEINCRYNLVQRTDTDGVTHIEVTTGPVVAAVKSPSANVASPDLRRSTRDGPPSSIISISTPESSEANENVGEDEGAKGGDEPPPQRPERKKNKTKPEVVDGDLKRQQKVVRGQFIRVNVNHGAALPASPEPERKPSVARPREASDSGGKSTSSSSSSSTAVAASGRLWSTADYDRPDGRSEQHRRSSRSSGRNRSRSSGPARRQLQPLQLSHCNNSSAHSPPSQWSPVAFSRYPDAGEQQQSSFGTRFFGKLREITSGNSQLSAAAPPQDLQPVTFRRRNSIGESVTANFYQYFNHNHHHHHSQYQQQQQQQQQQQLQHYYHLQQQQRRQQAAKNGGNLKSVIKKNNKSQPYQHAYDEPKKVTFSAYATVQVVD